MKPAAQTDEALVAWVKSIIERECQRKTFGVVAIHLENGRITRAKIETIEKPENSR